MTTELLTNKEVDEIASLFVTQFAAVTPGDAARVLIRALAHVIDRTAAAKSIDGAALFLTCIMVDLVKHYAQVSGVDQDELGHAFVQAVAELRGPKQ